MRKKGSLTVEAAFTFPIFFFAVLALSYLFFYQRIEYTIQREMYIAAQEISVYGRLIKPIKKKIDAKVYDIQKELTGSVSGKNTVQNLLLEIDDGIMGHFPGAEKLNLENMIFGATDKVLVGLWVKRYIPESVCKYVVDGMNGFDFDGSVLMDSEDCIEIRCKYKMKLPFSLFGELGISVSQNLRYRYFTGVEKTLLLELAEEIRSTPVPTEAVPPTEGAELTVSPTPEEEEPVVHTPTPGEEEPGTVAPTPEEKEPATQTPTPGGEEPGTVAPTPEEKDPETQTPTPGEEELGTVAPTPGEKEPETQTPTPGGEETGTVAPTPEESVTGTPTPTPEEKETRIVLITETGRVYHYTYGCPSLKVKPEKISFADVSLRRNEGGGKYYPCEHCIKKKSELTDCFITSDGDRYHSRSNCPGLKRTILEVEIENVGKRHECKRCRAYKDAWENNGGIPLR